MQFGTKMETVANRSPQKAKEKTILEQKKEHLIKVHQNIAPRDRRLKNVESFGDLLIESEKFATALHSETLLSSRHPEEEGKKDLGHVNAMSGSMPNMQRLEVPGVNLGPISNDSRRDCRQQGKKNWYPGN